MSQCVLCGLEAERYPIVSDDRVFCCHGCHAVFSILDTKNQLLNFQEHPIFRQALEAGLISNPTLLAQIKDKEVNVPDTELEKLHLEIDEMWCPSCAEVIRLILLRENGVKNCVVDYATDLASIEYAPRYLSKDKIYSIIQAMGYRPVSLESREKKAVSFGLTLRFVIAAFFSLNIMMFSYPIYAGYFEADQQGIDHLFAWISLFASLPVIGYSAWPIYRRFWTSLQVGLFGMEALVVMAVSAAFTHSLYNLGRGSTHVYFDSLSVIITFVLLGKIIEARAKFSAKESLFRLTRALPKRGRKVMPDGSEQYVPLKEIANRDILKALTGEKIVLDGVVIEGEGLCDESMMTGESIPVTKKKGSQLLGGTVLKQGSLSFRVSTESALQKIIEMVEQEIGHKTHYVRAADRIVKWFVPIVLLIAFSTLDLLKGISVLLISCPCAIGIAAPLAESQVMNGLARLGAIVRNRGCLPLLGRETTIVFDKTGTVTEGNFHVVGGLVKKPILKALCAQSTHPISVAISEAIKEDPIKLTHHQEVAGKGLRGEVEGHTYLLGSASFLKENGVPVTQSATVYFAEDGQLLSGIHLEDSIRPELPQIVQSMRPAKTLLLSGDHPSIVQSVAEACRFDAWKGECSPLIKREEIDRLRAKGEVVCMVGDGINDAPALSGANVSISVVSATDMSIQVSDILLTTARMEVLPAIRRLARRGQRVVKQNLFWAFFYNGVGVALAFGGYLTPLFAAGAMVTSSLIVVLNSYFLLDKGKRTR